MHTLHLVATHAYCSFWASDEYGPYIYRFSAEGALTQTIQPPAAILPMVDGALNFTGASDPDTGRASNKGTPVCVHQGVLHSLDDAATRF